MSMFNSRQHASKLIFQSCELLVLDWGTTLLQCLFGLQLNFLNYVSLRKGPFVCITTWHCWVQSGEDYGLCRTSQNIICDHNCYPWGIPVHNFCIFYEICTMRVRSFMLCHLLTVKLSYLYDCCSHYQIIWYMFWQPVSVSV
jgi:hypothetical protein